MYPTIGRCWSLGQDSMLENLNQWCSYKLENIHDEAKRAEVCGINKNDVRQDVLGIVLDEPLEIAKVKAKAVLDRGNWPYFYFTNGGKGGLRRKTYLDDMGGRVATNFFAYEECGHTDEAKKEVISIFDGKAPFDTPKPTRLIKRIFQIAAESDSLILDFFAGSGTTLHAVNLLNAEDGGHRRCIMVTNNEVSDAEAKTLTAQGYHPGDEEWNKLGIARYVTWPRTVCSIEGHDVNGQPLKGKYLGSDLPMADGIKANAAFFQLSFLNKTMVALGRQFRELLPVLWMKAGAHGPCPALTVDELPDMLVLPDNKFAVLLDESAFSDFLPQVQDKPEIETVFIVTDSSDGYKEMITHLNGKDTYQLYRDYLDNFRINIGR